MPGPARWSSRPADLVHLLVQRAAEGDVQFLDATADRQHRHPPRDRRADQRQRGGVAGGVVQFGRLARAASVMIRVDVARAAGHQQPIKAVKHGELRLTQRRDHDRDGTGAAQHRLGVARRGVVAQQAVDQFRAGGNADNNVHQAQVLYRTLL